MERRRSRSNSNVSLGAGESSSTEQKEPPPSTSTPTTSAPITTTAPTSSEAEPSAITTASASSVITTKPYIVHVESEPLSINQQLSNHLAATAVSQALLANSKPPAAKRKRGSLDTTQRSPLALKAQQPAEMKKIGFIGSGNIARAITEGWITGGSQVNAASHGNRSLLFACRSCEAQQYHCDCKERALQQLETHEGKRDASGWGSFSVGGASSS